MGRRMGLPSTTAARVSKTTSAVCRLHCHRIGVPGDVPPPMPLRSRDVVFGNGLRWIHGLKGQRCSGGESVGGGCGTPTESGLLSSAREFAVVLAFRLGGCCSPLSLGQRQYKRWPASKVNSRTYVSSWRCTASVCAPRPCLVSVDRVRRRLWEKGVSLRADRRADRSKLSGRL